MSKPSINSPARWFHVILTTYGAWPPGDPRGFRTRHHREHIDGDYKQPPARDKYLARAGYSKSLMKQPAVIIPAELRCVVGRHLKEKLERQDALVICIAVSGQHVHFLAKMPKSRVRSWSGLAKRHATFELRALGWKGKLWGVRGKVVPIKDRRHQLNVFKYIIKHEDEGAWVWKWESGKKGK